MTQFLSRDILNPPARTTQREGSPLPPDVLVLHLRVMIARVLRTGRGPEPLVRWVRQQLTDLTLADGDAADQLAERLLALFEPPITQTARV